VSDRATTEEIVVEIAKQFGDAELFTRRGRSKRFTLGVEPPAMVSAFEEGWAMRAGDRRGSFAAFGTGRPSLDGPWPERRSPPLRLPQIKTAMTSWQPGDGGDQGLLAEPEARTFLEAIDRALAKELAGARLFAAVLEDGSSESEIASSRGALASWRNRAASLRVEGTLDPANRSVSAALVFSERSAQRLQPLAIARRMADRLHVAREGKAPERDRGEFLMAPVVTATLLAAMRPFLVGPRAPARIEPLRDRRGRVASETVTLIDNGALEGGVLAAPVDGEGVATREVVLIDQGVFRQPLLAWWQARPPFERFSGICRRDGWRDLPSPGFSHFFLRPQPETTVAMLLGGVARGYYVLDVLGAVQLEVESGRFAVPVCGFAVQGGRATAPVAESILTGSIGGLLRNVLGVGRDLSFFPLDGMIGSPSLLVAGLEIRPR
jgi:predicted Zn-dependent protease